ncbi:hypothetical protein GCM10010344_38980 [Streptomyces bluensis]|nr:hypothetical protein GCM10010344_38980 [Streptomyces bluensis]
MLLSRLPYGKQPGKQPPMVAIGFRPGPLGQAAVEEHDVSRDVTGGILRVRATPGDLSKSQRRRTRGERDHGPRPEWPAAAGTWMWPRATSSSRRTG